MESGVFKQLLLNRSESLRTTSRKEALSYVFNKKRLKLQTTSLNAKLNEDDNFLNNEKINDFHNFHEKLQFQQKISILLKNIQDFDYKEIISEISYFRDVLTSMSENPRYLLEILYETKIFEGLIELIIPELYSHDEILTELFWFLSNIAVFSKPEENEYLIKIGLFDKCINVIKDSKFDGLIHDAFWTIGNLIDDSSERILRLYEGDLIMNCLKNPLIIKFKTQILIDLAFVLKISSKVKLPPGNFSIIKKMMDFSIIIFMRCEQFEGKMNALKAINNICSKYLENPQIRTFIINEFFSKAKKEFLKAMSSLVKNFSEKIESIANCYLNIINLFIFIEKEQIQILSDIELSETLYVLSFHGNEKISNYASFLTFDLICKNLSDIHLLFYDDKFIEKTFFLMQNTTCLQLKKSILACFLWILKKEVDYIIEKLLNLGIIELLLEVIEKNQPFLFQILELLENFIIYERNYNEISDIWTLKIIKNFGQDKLEKHILNPNKMIKQKTMAILSYL